MAKVRFPAQWCGTDLGKYRPSESTYGFYPIDTLPLLSGHRFTGAFDWLPLPGPVVTDQVITMEAIAEELMQCGLSLPQDFITYHTSSSLSQALEDVSLTGCWSELAGPIASPVESGAYIIQFLRDQQDSVIWYLYLRPTGESFVVHSYYLNYHIDPEVEEPELPIADLPQEIFWCAPSFEEFAYRFWVECQLRRVVNDDENAPGLTQDLREYLQHYRPNA